jgi:hypothetical protein
MAPEAAEQFSCSSRVVSIRIHLRKC